MWDTIVSTLAAEFSDLTDPAGLTKVVTRLLLAVTLAAIVGYERERRGSSAGLRTHMMVALGVCLLIVASEQSGMERESVSRVIQGVFAGIGFLGAGAIIKQDTSEQIRGLTTQPRCGQRRRSLPPRASAEKARLSSRHCSPS